MIWQLLFLLCLAGIVYVIAGYPLLLRWSAARKAIPVAKQPQLRSISILIAVHNGDKFLGDKLDSVVNADYPPELRETYVLSDGSTDRTAEIARSYADRGVQLLELPKGGKPAALNAGIARAKGEILILTDVRQVLERNSLREMVANFADPTIGVVSGDLPTREGIDAEESSTSHYWRYERAIRKNLGKLGSTFGATGPFYAIRRELAPVMPPDTLLDDMYVPLAAHFRGYRLVVDEDARAIEYPFSVQTEFRRKLRTLAGNYQIMMKYPALLSWKNRMLFHFVSYKIGRLALPWLFVGLFITSFGLPQPWGTILVLLQGVLYGLAAIDLVLAPDSALKRLATPARTVVTMLAAAALAVSVFFVPPHRLWVVTQARRRD
ncbi:MAG TPA: glycosyltransferase family 2 protein [Bryobacteraceae bacterium]|nr:glycosyltransferase family 2 protein [Bryobacteraceae bacterium]